MSWKTFIRPRHRPREGVLVLDPAVAATALAGVALAILIAVPAAPEPAAERITASLEAGAPSFP